MNLSNDFKILNLNAPTTAGTSAVVSTSVDTAGYDSVCFISSVGTPASNNTMKVSQSSDNSSFNDLASSKVTSNAANGMYVEVYRPAKRYLQVTVTRGTSTTAGDIWAILCDSTSKPVVNGTSALVGTILYTPSEGTA